MSPRPFASWRVAATRPFAAAAILALSCGALATSAAAATPETAVIATVTSDGTAPFNDTMGAGNDISANNLLVRTLDTISYRVDYQFNDLADVTKLVTMHVTNASFTEPPPSCLNPTVADAGSTMTCEVESLAQAGTVGTFNIVALVGAVRDGSVVTMTATTTAGATTASTSAEDVVVTATPRWDLATNYQAPVTRDVNSAGDPGFVLLAPVTVEADLNINDGKGTEALVGDISFVIAFSTAEATQPAYTLLDFDPVNVNSQALPCGPNDAALSWNLPYGQIGQSAGATANNSVTNSGVWTCTQTAPGEPITVTITGAALDTTQFPLMSPQGPPLSPRKIVISGTVAVFIDEAYAQSVLPPSGGVLPVDWNIVGFDPQGLSGGSNYDVDIEPLWNNTGEAGIVTFPPGMWDSMFQNNYAEIRGDHPAYGWTTFFDPRPSTMDPTHSMYVPTQSQVEHAGDGTITSGQTFTYFSAYGADENTIHDPQSVVMCTFVDAATTTVIDMPTWNIVVVNTTDPAHYAQATGELIPAPANGSPVKVRSTSNIDPNWGLSAPMDDAIRTIVEYGTGAWSQGDTCGDAASDSGWTTDPSTTAGAANGEYPAITKVRVRTIDPVVTDSQLFAWVALKADNAGAAGTWVTGSTSYGISDPANAWSGEADMWFTAPYDPNLHDSYPTSNVHFGDRLAYATSSLMVTKSLVGLDPGELVPGDQATFRLAATLFGESSSDVTLTDDLPAGLQYVSATMAPTSINGQQLVWDFGPTPGGTSYTVDVTVEVSADAPNGSVLVNYLTGAAADVAELGSILTSYASVRTAPDYVQLDVWKTTPFTAVEITDDVEFVLHSRNTANTMLTNLEWIDVLPYNGDARTPATDFTGAYTLSSVAPAGGETIRYTTQTPAAINPDPNDASNNNGTTIWCLPVEFTNPGCPADLAAATALRISLPSLAPAADMSVTITLTPTSNTAGDVYTNTLSGRASETPLLARSLDVPVEVVSSTLVANVVCAATGATLAGVGVTVDETGYRGTTGTDGSVRVTALHSGTYTVRFNGADIPANITVNTPLVQTVNLGANTTQTVTVDACAPTAPATTTTTEPTTEPTTTLPSGVLGDGANRGGLAFTGTETRRPVTAAMVLIASGLALVLMRRRDHTPARR